MTRLCNGSLWPLSKPLLLAWLFFVFIVSINPAWAALGQQLSARPGASSAALSSSPASPASPSSGAKMLALPPSFKPGLYTVEVTQLENGTIIRQYASLTGQVFAVAWQGPVLPDLYDLLGNYFSVFKLETDQARQMGRRGAPVDMSRDGLVVRSNGRMRNFFGHAYATDLVPAGVTIKDIFQ